MGSNAIAVGGQGTANGRGLLLGNPHYPWHHGRRFWQMHQTIPGKLDVSGAGLLGSPVVNIGHNASFGWSHTVATGVPFTLTELRLVPGDPTSYFVGGEKEKMTKRQVTVQVKQQNGSLKPVTATLTFRQAGLAILDGTRSSCAPGKAAGTVQPGILDLDRYPVLKRADYVTNSNDSYWLSNPDKPLTGYDRIIGDENTARSLRTRSGLVAVRDQLGESGFTRADMQHLVFANRNHAGELAAEGTVKMCRDMRLGEPCEILAEWDRTADTGSRGALLFDRYWRKAVAAWDLWKTPFDASDPVNTPRDFNTGSWAARNALIDAVDELRESNIPLDAPLGDHQYVTRDGTKIPIGGGTENQGILNKIEATWTPGEGYTEVRTGSSYVQIVSFDGDPCPDTRTLMTYSQSADPTSPHYADQTRLFSHKRWVTERFCPREIRKAPGLEVVRLDGG